MTKSGTHFPLFKYILFSHVVITNIVSAMPDNACSWDQSKGAPFVPALNSSTLFAYAMMRGPVTNGDYGPLYQVKASPHDSSNSVGLDALKVR